MVNPIGAASLHSLDSTNVANTNSSMNLSNLGDTAEITDMIGGASDLMTNISNNYAFIDAITKEEYSVDSVRKTLKTQKALEEFSYETELVSKVASVTVQGINTLVKMQ